MSNFVVSALKYRPARFEEVVGQEHVGQTLKNAYKNDHLAHAFLFCGPRGVGKTTCARILAKVLNCQNVTDNFEPCNTCEACKASNTNASFNVVELDAASNNSVDHIRQLVEQVRFQPQQGKYKVFIIDEVHMLSQAAFNAFLKTLEEPPPYAVFILATTEKHKIIPTILSRCQIFDFKRIQIPDMVAHLEKICATENIQAERDALHIVAQKADGALRDALSIFDRVISFSGKSITYNDVITNLNVLDYDYYFKLVDALLMEDVSGTLLLFNDILRKGFEGDVFLTGLAEHLRNLLVCKSEATLKLLEVSEGLKGRYRQQATMSSMSFLLTALNIANDCDVNYKMARHKPLHVEMALIKMTYIHRAVKIAQNPAAQNTEPQKKTPDVNNSNPNPKPPPTTPSTQAASAPYSAPTANTIVAESAPKPKENGTASITSVPAPPSKPEKKLGLKKNKLGIPSMGGLKNLASQIKAEEDAKQTIPRPELTVENVQKHWHAYAKTIPSNTARSVVKNTELKIKGDTVIAIVGSNMGKETIRAELNLMPTIRTALQHPDLMLEIEIDSSKIKAPPKKKKPTTVKEKYFKMRDINPLITDMIKAFELKPDEG